MTDIQEICLLIIIKTKASLFPAYISVTDLKRLYQIKDNHLLIFCVFSRGCSSNISQKYKLGNF
jgi:hypothetical protein